LRDIPKVFLTAKDAIPDKVFGFACGADDYITKPVVGVELKARVDARVARRSNNANQRFHCFEFDSDFQRCFLFYGDVKTDLELTPTEFRLFLTLARHEGVCVTRKELMNAIWESHGTHVEERGVDTHIGNLRKKLGTLSHWIGSVYGKGYLFTADSMLQKAE
jgi:DNA-binding response OmpR family regulator